MQTPPPPTHTRTHMDTSHLSKHAHKHSCKYQGLLYVLHSHTYSYTHTQRHLFTMVMSCSREWTSVAARPCWGWWCHANPSPTHMHTRFHCFSVPWSYKTACIHVLLGAVTLTCSLSRCSSVLLYVCSICTATRKWLSAAKIINSLEFKCLLSPSLGSLTGIILPCFCLAWRFQLWRLLMPVILSLCFLFFLN